MAATEGKKTDPNATEHQTAKTGAAADPIAQEHIRRLNRLDGDRSTIERVWQVIERFVAPYRGDFFRDGNAEQSVNWNRREIYDSTAVMASQMLAANMHSNLTSPSARWFMMRYNDPDLRNSNEAARWLEECSNITYEEIQASNFNLETAELYTDLATFGTGGLIEDVITNSEGDYLSLAFTSMGVKEIFFEDGFNGQPIRVYRKLAWTAAKIVSKFGFDNVPEHIQEAYTKGNQDTHDVVFAVWRRDGIDEDPFTTVNAKDRAWGCNYYLVKTQQPLQEEGGYYEMPAFIPRWRTTSDSRWGNSPAMIALPDILTLNELKQLVLKANEKVVDPTLFAEERALIGDLDFSPAGLNIVRKLNAVQPFESKARFDVSAMSISDLRDSIQRMFYIDQLQLKDSPMMTATEVQVRYEMMQRVLGPTLGRLRVDYIDKVVTRSFNILYRAGKFPPMPQVVADAGAQAAIDYTGPLARAQKVDQSASIERYIAQLQGLMQVDERVKDVPDMTEVAIFAADALGVPAKLINSRDKIKTTRDARAKQEQEQFAAEQRQLGAKSDALEATANQQRS